MEEIIIPKGFSIGGVSCGISQKKNKKDLSVIISEVPAKAAACFTRNTMKAAPVILSMKHIRQGTARLIIANSGCANACTGKKGLKDAEEIIKWVSGIFGIKSRDVLIASTGIIGEFLPVNKIIKGIKEKLFYAVGRDKKSLIAAAQGIMTTDTFSKIVFDKFNINKKEINIVGIAKGAGMICPNMATMLCFILTDLNISSNLLKKSLQNAVKKSFNMITVDGEMSTNDSVFILANGKAENEIIETDNKYFKDFQNKLDTVTLKLAKMIVKDGEGATKFVEINVSGARAYKQADLMARRIAHSPLFKSALFGNSPNWGRIMAACGSLKENINPMRIDIYFGNLCVTKNGIAEKNSNAAVYKVFSKKELTITVDLKIGHENAKIYTCDFSLNYVKINAD